MLGLYKNEVCFFISSFLAGKEAKEAGGTYDGSPLPPFQRSTGESKEGKARKKIPGAGGKRKDKEGPDGATGTARPLSIAPAQGDGVNVSRQVGIEKAPRGRKAKEGKKLE